jgi:hypothetical protein
MAVANEEFAVTYVAGEDIGLGVACKMSTAAAKTVLKATDGALFIGMCMMAVTTGASTPVCIAGRVKVRTAGIIGIGVKVSVNDADGRIKASATGDEVIGFAEEASTAADQYISVLLVNQAGVSP